MPDSATAGRIAVVYRITRCRCRGRSAVSATADPRADPATGGEPVSGDAHVDGDRQGSAASGSAAGMGADVRQHDAAPTDHPRADPTSTAAHTLRVATRGHVVSSPQPRPHSTGYSVRAGTPRASARCCGVDSIDSGPADAGVVLVFGPVVSLEQVVGRLIECGALADADSVVSDPDNPARGSCVLHVAEGGRPGRGGARRRGVPAGILHSVVALWRGPDRDAARPSGRHRAQTGR
jgi:hypothetical protein